jgi:hypothetical protein
MSYPRTYPTGTGDNKLDEKDWNAMKNRIDGFTPSGTFVSSYTYVVSTDGTDTYASNAFQTVYGGPDDAGSVDGGDAYAVINACISNIASTGSIFITAGVYTLTSGLVIDGKAISIYGEGPGASELRGSSTDVVLTIKNSPAFPNQHLTSVIRDISIMGAPTLAGGSRVAAKAVNLIDTKFITFQNVWMSWSNGEGLTIQDSILNCFINCQICFNVGAGVTVAYDDMVTTYQSFFACAINSNETMGVHLTNSATAFEFYGCDFEANVGTYQVYLYEAIQTLFYGCHFETENLGNTAHVGITGATTCSRFNNCYFSSGTIDADVIIQSQADNTTFRDCLFAVNRPNVSLNVAATDTCTLIGNSFGGSVTRLGGIMIAHDNTGLITEKQGYVTGTEQILTIAHGLSGVPTFVSCSFSNEDVTGWGWTANGTNLFVTVTGTDLGTYTTYWKAEYVL